MSVTNTERLLLGVAEKILPQRRREKENRGGVNITGLSGRSFLDCHGIDLELLIFCGARSAG